MSYVVEYDREVWYPVPASFPAESGATMAEWKGQFVELFERALGGIPTDGVLALDEFASVAFENRPARAAESLIFCPRFLPALGIVNILVTATHDDEVVDLREIAAGDSRAQLPPTIEEVSTEHLGEGIRAATVVASSDGESAAGAFIYAFERQDHLVVVGGTADRIPDATAMLPFLDLLVEGIRVEAE